MDNNLLKLENQLCFPFYAVSRLIIRAYQDDLDELGITYPQYLVMLVLWDNDRISVNEIADKLILNTNTVTPLLKRMEGIGLLTREQSKTDQRKVIISLSENGKSMKVKASEIPVRLIKKLNIEPTEVNLKELNNLKSTLYKFIEKFKPLENQKN